VNKQLKTNKEKFKVSENSNLNVSITSLNCGKNNLPPTFLFLCSLLLVLFFVSCDLFTGSKVDLYQEISDRVDWANAPKLTVRIDFPSAWGVSNPPQGDITPVKDLRKGYEFSVEFTPDITYTLKSWQVFFTSDLESLSGNWLEDPTLINPKDIVPLGPDEVTLPEPNARGGTFKFTIQTVEPVTLVPWCETQPHITRTDPRNRPTGDPVSRASAVVIYFNSALNTDTVKFADSETGDGIWITAESLDDHKVTAKQKDWYNEPVFVAAGGFFMVTISPSSTLPPGNSLMTVQIKGIQDVDGVAMEGVYSFSWKTRESLNIYFNSWSAEYFHDAAANSGYIKVSYDQETTNDVKTYYRLNKGTNSDFDVTDTGTATINNVLGPDASGVREGKQVSDIREYEIFIELYESGAMTDFVSFKIWNFPGMKVSDKYPAVEVRTQAELAAMKNNSGGQYVLANDITVTGEWTPIGGMDKNNPTFTGKFYGNGHTVTLNAGFGGSMVRGFFGAVQNALIRDFTLEYKRASPIITTLSPTTIEMDGQTLNTEMVIIGGLVGYLLDTNVINIITSGGTLAITVPSGGNTSIVSLGGIAGNVNGSGKIENSHAALSVKYTSTGHEGMVIMGAITAITGDATGESIKIDNGLESGITLPGLLLNEITIDADVSAIKGSYSGEISIGGAVGRSGQNTLNDITFKTGTVSFSRSSTTSDSCGGIIGTSTRTNMVKCLFLGNIKPIGGTIAGAPGNQGDISIGGLVGRNDDGNTPGRPMVSGNYYIHNCRVRGDIGYSGISYAPLTIAGIFAASNKYDPDSNIIITDCFFEDGNITVDGTAPLISVGGFIGRMGGGGQIDPDHTINNCGALKGTIIVNNADGAVQIGGFTSEFAGTISKCFSRIDIIVESKNDGLCCVGGFIGTLTGTINNCYATGTISVVTESKNLSSQPNYHSYPPYIGGLVGGSSGTITNSYALGNVLASDSGTHGPISVGGLVGFNQIGQGAVGGNISNCFSAGQISAQSKNTTAYSGGIVGSNQSGTINYTAALGKSVTARGVTKNAGRIYGEPATSLALSLRNYALKAMTVELGAYNDSSPIARLIDSGVNKPDGDDTASSAFLAQAFWTGTTTLNFSTNLWNFNRVAIEGYPRLKWE